MKMWDADWSETAGGAHRKYLDDVKGLMRKKGDYLFPVEFIAILKNHQ